MKSDRRIGVGVIGVGSIGKVHAHNLANRIPRANLAAIADSNIETGRTVAAKLGVDQSYSDYNQLLEKEEVEAVVIAVPPFLKRDMIIAAARAGKHIFVEKPMAPTLNDIDQALQEVSKARVKLQVGYMRRFDNSFLRAKAAIDAGEIGRLLMIKSYLRDPPSAPAAWEIDPKLTGGIFVEACSHDFDVIRWLGKTEVIGVYAEGANLVNDQLKPHGGFDNVMVILRLQNGALADVDCCLNAVYGHDVRAEVVGTEGAVFVGMGQNSATQILKKSSQHGDPPMTYIERFEQAYRDELSDFVECVLEDRQPKVTGQDGRAAVEIGLGAAQSIVKQAPVHLPIT